MVALLVAISTIALQSKVCIISAHMCIYYYSFDTGRLQNIMRFVIIIEVYHLAIMTVYVSVTRLLNKPAEESYD